MVGEVFRELEGAEGEWVVCRLHDTSAIRQIPLYFLPLSLK